MVHLNLIFMRKRTFIDSLRILVKGGRGGNGFPKYGGVGGKGGDVVLKAVEPYSLAQLKKESPSQRFVAGPGADSKRFCILGEPSKDVTIQCPPGVSVLSEMQEFGSLNKVGETILLAKGGNGGGPQNNYIGEKGQSYPLTLDLKLLADVGFVGFPNAGKSTLLKALSKAKPKIASYPFTTIEPKIGILEYSDYRSITAADLPGLISGAHINLGMGHKFLKHCMRTKVLLFVVDVDGFRLSPETPFRTAFETIMLLNRELELYDRELVHKPAILAVNKMDQDSDGKKFEELKFRLKNYRENLSSIPAEQRPETVMQFDATLAISAKFGGNVPVLKEKIRTVIDIHCVDAVAASGAQDTKDDVVYV